MTSVCVEATNDEPTTGQAPTPHTTNQQPTTNQECRNLLTTYYQPSTKTGDGNLARQDPKVEFERTADAGRENVNSIDKPQNRQPPRIN
jgi:hypothetical protein